jgi:uncharacterized membrane protein YvlD (DUF360 family)
MRNLLWHWIISVLALLLAAWALQGGIHISPWYQALWIAPLLGLVNVIVGALARVLSWVAFPVNMLTLGCFGFILSFFGYIVAIQSLGRGNLPGFRVDSIPWAFALAVVMALFSTVLNMILPGKDSRRK